MLKTNKKKHDLYCGMDSMNNHTASAWFVSGQTF